MVGGILLGIARPAQCAHAFVVACRIEYDLRAGYGSPRVCMRSLALRELFTRPTLLAFAEVVPHAAMSTLGRIEAVNRDRPLPLSLAQQRLWFLGQLDEAASRAYHMPAALRL